MGAVYFFAALLLFDVSGAGSVHNRGRERKREGKKSEAQTTGTTRRWRRKMRRRNRRRRVDVGTIQRAGWSRAWGEGKSSAEKEVEKKKNRGVKQPWLEADAGGGPGACLQEDSV